MRLVYTDPLLEINLNYLNPVTIIIENKRLLVDFVGDLWNRVNGQSGRLILSDEEKELKLDKKADFVFNIFEISCNGKKIINNIFSQLTEISNEELQPEVQDLNAGIVSFLDKISGKLPYDLTFDLDLDIGGLLKLYNMKIDEESEDYLSRLVSYVKLSHQVVGIEVFAFLNLKQFFSEKELELLYEAFRYEQVCIIDIEGIDPGLRTKGEKCVIIDKDFCVINLD